MDNNLCYTSTMENDSKNKIDPKDLMAVERATTALIGTAVSLIVLGFVVEKFELFLHLISSPRTFCCLHRGFITYYNDYFVK